MTSRAVLFPHPDPRSRPQEPRAPRGARGRRADGGLARAPAGPRCASALGRGGGTRPLWIAPGGSSGLGVLGAAEGALEVVEAARAGVIRMPEDVVVAAGSCGTAAGLALGFALAGVPVRVVAVRVVPRIVASRRQDPAARGVRGSAILAEAALSRGVDGRGGRRRPDRGGPGLCAGRHRPPSGRWPSPGPPVSAAETTYTGKAWAHVLSGALRGRRVMFWNTFGG